MIRMIRMMKVNKIKLRYIKFFYVKDIIIFAKGAKMLKIA